MKKDLWKYLFLSFIIPVVGGLIVYEQEKNKNSDFAHTCRLLSLLHPTVVGIIFSIIFGFLLGIFSTLIYGEFVANEFEIQLYSILIAVIVNFFFMIGLMETSFKGSLYRNILPIWYFGLIGFIWTYFKGYKGNNEMRDESTKFVGAQLLAIFVLGFVVNLIFAVLFRLL